MGIMETVLRITVWEMEKFRYLIIDYKYSELKNDTLKISEMKVNVK